MAKLTFDEAMEKIGDGHHVKYTEVLASAAKRKVWVAYWCYPGCLYEHVVLCLTKKEAIEAAVEWAYEPERGYVTKLKRYGRAESRAFGARALNYVEKGKLGDHLG